MDPWLIGCLQQWWWTLWESFFSRGKIIDIEFTSVTNPTAVANTNWANMAQKVLSELCAHKLASERGVYLRHPRAWITSHVYGSRQISKKQKRILPYSKMSDCYCAGSQRKSAGILKKSWEPQYGIFGLFMDGRTLLLLITRSAPADLDAIRSWGKLPRISEKNSITSKPPTRHFYSQASRA